MTAGLPGGDGDGDGDDMRPAGLLQAISRMLTTLFESICTRAEIVALDVQEAVQALVGLLLWAFVALLALAAALFIAALALILAFWDTHRVLVAVLMMSVFLGLAVWAAWTVRIKLRAQRTLFTTTRTEFKEDREVLRARP